MRIQIKKPGDLMVSPRTQLERLQASVQATLLLVKQTPEQDDGCLKFVRYLLGRNDTGIQAGLLETCLSRPQLLLSLLGVASTVQIQTGDHLADDPALADQLQ